MRIPRAAVQRSRQEQHGGAGAVQKAGIHTAWRDSGGFFEQGTANTRILSRITTFYKREKEKTMLFCNIDLLDENFERKRGQYVGVKDGKIALHRRCRAARDYGERYDGKHRLLMSGFYNVHSHAPMTLLRGYAENLPLQRWLGEKVFPFEDKIDDEAAYYGTQLSIAEMLASGTVSFSDMYFFFDGMMPAIRETASRNLSRGLTVF